MWKKRLTDPKVLSMSEIYFVDFFSPSNLHYTGGITPKRVTSGGVRIRSLAPGRHNSKETWLRWRAVSDNVSDLTDPGIEPQTFCTDSDVFDR